MTQRRRRHACHATIAISASVTAGHSTKNRKAFASRYVVPVSRAAWSMKSTHAA